MSADLDALDRGLVDVGLTAAEALSRVAALEAKVDRLARALVAVVEAAGLTPLDEPARHLQVVREQ
jgi:hypothetical protein